ncbi:MAG: tetratricopeptide repeat protein [Oscillatoriales cyanobacterium]|nr:MAG: tetratricopeptide repeat protein [Oscillatoriales cyanobacterium]
MMRRFLAILLISAFAVIVPHIAFALTPQQVNQIAAQATVLIDGYQPGSGVIFQRNGNVYSVLTAKHVVNVDEIYYVITPEGERHRTEATNIQLINDMDLAVVQFTSDKVYQVAQLGNSDKVPKGSTVYVAGAPEANETIPQRTLIVNPGTLVGVQPPQDGYALIYNNITQPGMSGGPVLNEEGQVIGIHGQGDRRNGSKSGLNLAIPINASLVPNLQKLVASPSPPTPSPVVPSEKSAIDPSPSPSPQKSTTEKQNKKAAEPKKEAIKTVQTVKEIETHNWWNGFWNLFWSALITLCGILIIAIGAFIMDSVEREKTLVVESVEKEKTPVEKTSADFVQKINDKDAINYFIRGNACLKSGENPKAIVNYTQAIMLEPNYVNAYINRGNAYLRSGNKHMAIADYTQAIHLAPYDATPYYNRGCIHKDHGNKQEAIQDFQKAADLHMQQGNQDLLQKSLKKVQELVM